MICRCSIVSDSWPCILNFCLLVAQSRFDFDYFWILTWFWQCYFWFHGLTIWQFIYGLMVHKVLVYVGWNATENLFCSSLLFVYFELKLRIYFNWKKKSILIWCYEFVSLCLFLIQGQNFRIETKCIPFVSVWNSEIYFSFHCVIV